MKVKSESEVSQLCPTLSGPMDCSLPGSSIHGIFQARVLEWGVIAFSAYGLYWCTKTGTLLHSCSPFENTVFFFPLVVGMVHGLQDLSSLLLLLLLLTHFSRVRLCVTP